MDNLQELNINSISIGGRISLEDGVEDQLSTVLTKHQSSWPRRSIDKLGLYEVDGIRHHLGLDIEIIREAAPSVAIISLEAHSFSSRERLRASARNRQMKQFSEIKDILFDLEATRIIGRFHPHIVWVFSPDSKKPIVSLPLMTMQGRDAPFTEISGVRLNRATDDGNVSVTMDLTNDRSLFVTLVLPPARTTVSENMIGSAVQRGSQMIKEFILDTEIPTGEAEAQS